MRLFVGKTLEKEPGSFFVRQIANERFDFRVESLHVNILTVKSLESRVASLMTDDSRLATGDCLPVAKKRRKEYPLPHPNSALFPGHATR